MTKGINFSGADPRPAAKYTALERAGRLVIQRLEIDEAFLADFLGTSPIVTRKFLVGGSLQSHPAALEHLMKLLQIYSMLSVLVGDGEQDGVPRVLIWFKGFNHHFGKSPEEMIGERDGLNKVLNYLQSSL